MNGITVNNGFPRQLNRTKVSLCKKICPRHDPKSPVLIYILNDNRYKNGLDCYNAFSYHPPPPQPSSFGVSTLIYTRYLTLSQPYTCTADSLC